MIKGYCAHCKQQDPKREYELVCDACGETVSRGVAGVDNPRRRLVHVEVGRMQFGVCAPCVARIGVAFTDRLHAAAREVNDRELAEELEALL